MRLSQNASPKERVSDESSWRKLKTEIINAATTITRRDITNNPMIRAGVPRDIKLSN
jgi:hypothetical protein